MHFPLSRTSCTVKYLEFCCKNLTRNFSITIQLYRGQAEKRGGGGEGGGRGGRREGMALLAILEKRPALISSLES
jgi:hypothetical protein